MYASIKTYLYGAGAFIFGVFLLMYRSTRSENKLLKEVNKGQEEALKVIDVKEVVSNTIHEERIVQKASLEASIEEIKEKVKNETTSNSDTLDPEYIKLLNKNSNKV